MQNIWDMSIEHLLGDITMMANYIALCWSLSLALYEFHITLVLKRQYT